MAIAIMDIACVTRCGREQCVTRGCVIPAVIFTVNATTGPALVYLDGMDDTAHLVSRYRSNFLCAFDV